MLETKHVRPPASPFCSIPVSVIEEAGHGPFVGAPGAQLSEGDVSSSIPLGVTPNAINFLLGQYHEGVGTCSQPILQLLAVSAHPLEET